MRHLARLFQAALLVVSSTACSIHVQRENSEFDKLCGKGPVLIIPADETAVSTAFFRTHWQASPAIKHLVMQRGAPEAISVEREFLKPHRLKLFYPAAGQVYLLDQVGGEWLVAGSEPVGRNDLELVSTQRNRASATSNRIPPIADVAPLPATLPPIAAVAPTDFRGRLKPPVMAGVAKLTKADNQTGSSRNRVDRNRYYPDVHLLVLVRERTRRRSYSGLRHSLESMAPIRVSKRILL